MQKLLYNLMNHTLRKLIDWMMSLWLWANKREQQIEERRRIKNQ